MEPDQGVKSRPEEPEIVGADDRGTAGPEPGPVEAELLIEDVSIDGMCGVY